MREQRDPRTWPVVPTTAYCPACGQPLEEDEGEWGYASRWPAVTVWLKCPACRFSGACEEAWALLRPQERAQSEGDRPATGPIPPGREA